ncbi:MAG: ABC transporter permease [Bacteroidales bacterium]|nr:ABC transporter permease [Bacteroidales bacterium]MBN2818280.1 ABC transporter permease [Bacteroidales bacterium]
MNRFKAFVIKEFRHLIRDPRTVFVLFAIPVIQLLLFGFVISTEIKDAKIAILDFSRDDLSEGLVNKILASDYFILETELSNINQIEQAFRSGQVKEVLVIENNFGRNIVHDGAGAVQIITDASDPNIASLLDSYTRNIILDYQQEISNKTQAASTIIDVEYRMFYNEELKSAHLFVPGTMALILMLVCALMTSVSIAREKELGTMEILLVSPLRPLQIVLGKVVPYMVLSFIDMLVIIVIGHFVFGVPVRGATSLLIGTGTLFILLALTLGVMISTISKTQQIAMMISLVGMMLPTVLLSGFIFPLKNMPVVLQAVSLAMPPRWFLQAVKDVMLKGAGIAQIWHYLAIMFGMLLFFIMVSVKKFKIRLD